MNEREMIEIARPCVRNELNRCEQNILMIEKSKPTPAHLMPAKYLAALNMEATRLRTTLDSIDAYLGLGLETKPVCGSHTGHDETCAQPAEHSGPCV